MKNRALLTRALFVVFSITSVALISLMEPRKAFAGDCTFGSHCDEPTQTPTVAGTGGDCGSAHSAALQAAWQYWGQCGAGMSSCGSTSYNVATACFWNGSAYEEDGYLEYGCGSCY